MHWTGLASATWLGQGNVQLFLLLGSSLLEQVLFQAIQEAEEEEVKRTSSSWLHGQYYIDYKYYYFPTFPWLDSVWLQRVQWWWCMRDDWDLNPVRFQQLQMDGVIIASHQQESQMESWLADQIRSHCPAPENGTISGRPLTKVLWTELLVIKLGSWHPATTILALVDRGNLGSGPSLEEANKKNFVILLCVWNICMEQPFALERDRLWVQVTQIECVLMKLLMSSLPRSCCWLF